MSASLLAPAQGRAAQAEEASATSRTELQRKLAEAQNRLDAAARGDAAASTTARSGNATRAARGGDASAGAAAACAADDAASALVARAVTGCAAATQTRQTADRKDQRPTRARAPIHLDTSTALATNHKPKTHIEPPRSSKTDTRFSGDLPTPIARTGGSSAQPG
jgi:hypothetical protein